MNPISQMFRIFQNWKQASLLAIYCGYTIYKQFPTFQFHISFTVFVITDNLINCRSWQSNFVCNFSNALLWFKLFVIFSESIILTESMSKNLLHFETRNRWLQFHLFPQLFDWIILDLRITFNKFLIEMFFLQFFMELFTTF